LFLNWHSLGGTPTGFIKPGEFECLTGAMPVPGMAAESCVIVITTEGDDATISRTDAPGMLSPKNEKSPPHRRKENILNGRISGQGIKVH
jgi:hypothetical protein